MTRSIDGVTGLGVRVHEFFTHLFPHSLAFLRLTLIISLGRASVCLPLLRSILQGPSRSMVMGPSAIPLPR